MAPTLSSLFADSGLGRELLIAGFGVLLGTLLGHRIHRATAAKDRVSQARIALRKWIHRVEAETGFDAWATHQELCPAIFEMRHSLPGDLPWWRRRRFDRACAAYLAIPGADLQPRIDPLPIGIQRTKEAKEQDDEALQRPVKLLAGSLGAILRAI